MQFAEEQVRPGQGSEQSRMNPQFMHFSSQATNSTISCPQFQQS
ncbi:MAG: hypothetical protein ABEJ69_01670 [Candidatus Nanohaloarchaea archaeon]